MANAPRPSSERTIDVASIEMLDRANVGGIETVFSRSDAQGPSCGFGLKGICCRICHMGPCRITPKNPKGICGADADTLVARNLLREIAGGSAAHSDHGRHLVLLLRKAAKGEGGNYAIRDSKALRRAAALYKVPVADRTDNEIALELSEIFLNEFASQEEDLATLKLAPLKQQGRWQKAGCAPQGIDRMVVEAMHRTTMGVDHDYKNLLKHGFACALADGWGGSRVASMTSDILFGTPKPVRSQANLGVLGENTVNVVVHGHEPALSEMLAVASMDPEIQAAAKAVGAERVTLAGICCTANEVLMRHGIPVAGNFLQQELAILTGAVEMMVTDVQCCMPSLPGIAALYHSEIVSTSEMAQTIGSTAAHFDETRALESAKDLLKRAIANYPRRDRSRMAIPSAKAPLVAGFSVHAIKQMLGGQFRAGFRPLNDAIISGRIHGVVGIVGCSNPKQKVDEYTMQLTRELIRRNVLILKTGCAAIASAKQGMLTPEAALAEAGPGLKEVCETVGIPPILHMGSCVDNSRILEAASEVVFEGGLGDDIAGLPAVGVAPEWMSEKAVAIGFYVVASGIDVVLGHPFHTAGSENVTKYLNEGCRERYGASFHLCADAAQAVDKIMALLDQKRAKLGINRKQERKMLGMSERRTTAITPHGH